MGNRTNKREKEQEERQNHLQLQRRHALKGLPTRTEAYIPIKSKILIVCEGTNTEPSYLRKFKYASATIEKLEVKGTGYNTLSLVELAQRLQENKYPDHKEVWCVFDADPKPDNPQQLINFDKAIAKAQQLGYNVAYSHQAFEYWLLLHFEDHQGGAMQRHLYYDKINKYLHEIKKSIDYDKESKIITPTIFDILQAIDKKYGKTRQELALTRARKIDSRYSHHKPSEEESSTTVFKLVCRLTCNDVSQCHKMNCSFC